MAGKPKALGRHLLVDLWVCDEKLLTDEEFIRTIMLEAAQASRATVVDESFHLFEPYGVSGVVVIAESHISIHTWPEYRYAAVDVFSCGKDMKPEEAIRVLAERLRAAENPVVLEVPRGVLPKSIHGLVG